MPIAGRTRTGPTLSHLDRSRHRRGDLRAHRARSTSAPVAITCRRSARP